MSSKAPIEIWHTILKYSISVPLFFDPDPVSTYGIEILREYSYEAPYWDSERMRNSLRRVCWGWNHLLQGYNHRFIRLFDVMHGRVPITALPFVIRLDLDDSYHCKCKEFCNFGVKRWSALESIWNTASLPLCGVAVGKTAEPDHWKLEIVKGWFSTSHSFYKDLKVQAPKVKAMISQPAADNQISIGLLPSLKLFLTGVGDSRLLFDIGKISSLVTLHITVESLRAPVAKDRLPALRHLSINIDLSETPSKEELYSFLKGIGSNLLTFHLRHSLSSISIDQCLWDLLPNAERLQLPHRWIGCNVPPGHPLQAIQISMEDLHFLDGHKSAWERIFVPHPPFSFESHRVVRIDRNWSEELASKHNLRLLMKIKDYYECLDIPLLDARGETLSQYILFVIKTFWKQRVKISRKPQSDYAPGLF